MSEHKATIPSWPRVFIPQIVGELPPLRLNTQSGPQEITSQNFRMYVCGITPYDATHLGHAATYLTYDMILRYLTAQGVDVQFAENITDIDEPLLERAARDNIDWKDLANSQVALYRSDMTALHIQPPQSFVPVTHVMSLVIDAIATMQRRGHVYDVDGDLYFDVTPFLESLPIPLEEALTIFGERGGDPLRSGKKHPLDPVLWLKARDGEPSWDGQLGSGRPGWHIECAVIALHFLAGESFHGETSRTVAENRPSSIDLQGGGTDLIFPHHFMSAAQSSAITGRPFASAYVHSAMVGLDGEKMSKSKGNLVFVSRLLQEGEDPMVIRWALLSHHYQSDRMWIPSSMDRFRAEVAQVRSALSREEVLDTREVISEIASALSENLDTPRALASLLAWAQGSLSETGKQRGAGELARTLDALLGLAL